MCWKFALFIKSQKDLSLIGLFIDQCTPLVEYKGDLKVNLRFVLVLVVIPVTKKSTFPSKQTWFLRNIYLCLYYDVYVCLLLNIHAFSSSFRTKWIYYVVSEAIIIHHRELVLSELIILLLYQQLVWKLNGYICRNRYRYGKLSLSVKMKNCLV